MKDMFLDAIKISFLFIIFSIEWVYCFLRDTIEGTWEWLIYGKSNF